MKYILLLFASTILSHGNLPEQSIVLNDSGTMPFELIKEKIIIPVQIGGNTYKFLVDTGGIFEISEELQNLFNFKQKEAITIVDINRNETIVERVVVPEIKLGDWSFKNRNAIVSDLHHTYPYSCFELDGMIGRDFFDNVLLHFDYASSTFRITKNTNAIALNTSNRTKLKLSKRGLPDIKLKVNGKTEYIEFDSGSGDFYSPRTSDVEKRVDKSDKDDILTFQGKFSFGVTMDTIKTSHRYIEKVKSFQIANTTFHNFYSQFSKVSAARIGAAILKYGKVTLDYKNGWFYYEPYAKNQTIDPLKTFGFDVAIEDGAYTVKYILKGSAADTLGLRSGSTILMLDTTATQNISEDCEGYLYGYPYKDKEIIKVTFLDEQGNEKSIELNSKIYR
tara:strand:- start:44168 stop:45343 length:1176 start_codon:yes stop_codon:yes gene_type:complete